MSELFSAAIAAMEADLDPANPLAKPWSLELGLPDFSVLKHEDFEPAISNHFAFAVEKLDEIRDLDAIRNGQRCRSSCS